jgi:hypothetical protein
METGYFVDHGQGVTYPLAWVAGVMRWSRWFGVRAAREEKTPVTTYRCPQCGMLASYARPGNWPI